MKISEIFYSIQGEGKLAGLPSVFIRTSGCNLRCTWCDTPYTSWTPEGETISVDQVLKQTARHRAAHVVVTGGEPMIDPDIVELTHRLQEADCHVTIETAATLWKEAACDLASISPKLANSTPAAHEGGRYADAHEKNRINLDVIRRFMTFPDYQLKFVVERLGDLGEIDAMLDQIGPYDPANVLLMPQGVTQEQIDAHNPWIAQACKERGFRYGPRLHISLFGHVRGT